MGEVRDLASARGAHRHSADHELTLPAERQAPRLARHWVMRVAAAAGVGGTHNQVIEVLTGELVADAVLRSDVDDQVTIGLRIGDDTVRVAVTGPYPLVPTPSSTTSLALVEVLSSAWGMSPLPHGEQIVWFDVEIAG